MQSICGTLPPGYRLEEGGPDLWLLRRPDGWPVCTFGPLGVAREHAARLAWKDYRLRRLRVCEAASEEARP